MGHKYANLKDALSQDYIFTGENPYLIILISLVYSTSGFLNFYISIILNISDKSIFFKTW